MGIRNTIVSNQERFYDLFDRVQECWYTHLHGSISEKEDAEFYDMLKIVQHYYENDLYRLALYEITDYRKKMAVYAANDGGREISGHAFVFARRLQDVEALLSQHLEPMQRDPIGAPCLVIRTDAFQPAERNLLP